MKNLKTITFAFIVLFGGYLLSLLTEKWDSGARGTTILIALGMLGFYYIEKEAERRSKKLENANVYKSRFRRKVFPANASTKYGNSYVCILEAECDLRIQPQVGMTITIDIDAENGNTFYSDKIIKVDWVYWRFDCEADPFILSDKNDFGAVIESQLRNGWKLPPDDNVANDALKKWQQENKEA